MQKQQCSIVAQGSGLAVQTPYDQGFVAALKSSIPATERTFDRDARAWVIAPQHGKTAATLIQAYFGQLVLIPVISSTARTETRILEVRYLGACKDRGDGSSSAFGLVQGSWSVVFPEEALRQWFEAGSADPMQQRTLYAVLGAKQQSSTDDIKSAYRRMAKQWHPDVCKEPGAHEVFIRVQEAYGVLSNPLQRARYDAGLLLQSTTSPNLDPQVLATGYRSPLRCGWIMAEGHESLGRFIVSKILGWQDIINSAGQTLVVSWPAGATEPLEAWA